ncbi:ATP-binding cassette domain-containing protein [Salmonella enterica subsp. enterica serovar Javiana]|nr:energy-coupling factor ABC transporter ATP-binding protein [Salmonella enterica subsp. enterica serovar Javiana]EEG7331279.1 ATP-binding cassette domain-containing protein [Salmonella enterica subsp. enterica serovar Javiana]EEK7938465.1 ATP-binding cassette domain-containing protein [Salmonella enterica subsp. enterica serovar Javiana]EEK8081606.1 ATP-binding cassette domain-containing protein [Salmonella enterica subsp. enterica serovar Javiana]EEK8087095.1 ATP-binding cassette domain-cont
MTGLDRLSYQSRWAHVAPQRKFLLWLAMMILAFALPPVGQGIELLIIAGLSCWLLRISLWRWCRWMAIPFGFLLVGVITIIFSISREPQMLLAGISVGPYWIGITRAGVVTANETFWRSLTALSATLWQGKPLDYSKRGLLALRQQVATVFQDPEQQIFYTDIDSDIAFSLRNLGVPEAEITRRVDEALTLVDAQHFRHQPIQCLSHGQKKRVAIAGALVLQARYLLLDEPTAGLDPAGRTQMLAIIRRIVAQGNHVIISSHDIDLIYEISDAVYVLRQGQVLTHGAPGEVFACTEAMEQAGLTQPWLVKLHTQLGLPLCKTETEFFHRMQKCAFREAS